MSEEIHRGPAFRTELPDRSTAHAFSFGSFYDPANLGFGPLICHNDDRVRPGGGYAEHPHSEVEIVTWVLDGELTHTEDGKQTALSAGTVQVTSAGVGIRHAETVDPAVGPTRFLQVWLRPDAPGAAPRTTRTGVPVGADWVEAVGGDGLPVGVRGARLLLARPQVDGTLEVPDARAVHLYVARGAVEVEDAQVLHEADAWRLTDAGARRLTCRTPGTELLVWAFG